MVDDVLSYLANKPGGLTRLKEAVKEARSKLARHADQEARRMAA